MIFYIFHQNVLFLHQNEENHRKHLKTIKISSCLLFLMKKQIPTQKSPRRIFLIGTVTHMYEFSRTQQSHEFAKFVRNCQLFLVTGALWPLLGRYRFSALNVPGRVSLALST